MQLIDKSIHDILPGYRRIIHADTELLHKWREPLLEIYAKQRSAYEQELSKYRLQKSESLSRIRAGIWLSSLILAIGLIILPVLITISELGDLRGPLLCFSPLLILGGLTGWAIIAVLWIWQRDEVKPTPPVHPLKTTLVPPLILSWKRNLTGPIQARRIEEKDKGVFSIIARLQTIDSEAYIIHKLQLDSGKWIDLALIGPQGIWVFEVVHQDGTIRWREGRWTHRRTYLRLSGPALTEIRDSADKYDHRWNSAVDNITATIKESLPDLIERSPNILRVRGGLVFSHRKVKVDIPPGCPFNWGIIPFWVEKLREVPPVPGLNEQTVFTIIDLLVSRHNKISGADEGRSMLSLAHDLFESEDSNLKSTIESAS
jgi:Nuclease-related domain